MRADEPFHSRDFGADAPGTATVRPLDGGPPRGSFPVEISVRGTRPTVLGRRFHLEDEGVAELCFHDELNTGQSIFDVGGCWPFR